MDVEQARKFGQMESRLDALERSVEDMRTQSLRMEAKLDKVVERIASNTGGTTMLITLLTISAAVGGLITKIVEMVSR